MKTLIAIFIGGGLGSVLRFLVSTYTQKAWSLNGFPMGTFLVNIIGCYLIGLFSVLVVKDSSTKMFLVAGFCGGFTTFSAFAAETQVLVSSSQWPLAFLYIILSVLVGIFAVYFGMLTLKN